MRLFLTFMLATMIAILSACAPQAELVKTRTDLTDLRDDVEDNEDPRAGAAETATGHHEAHRVP